MAETTAPRRVRIASALTWMLGLAGLLLVIDGLLELRWWNTPEAARLVALIAEIRLDRGVAPPILLRGQSGAVEMVILGTVCMACATLAPLINKGRLWARTWILVLGFVTFVVGLIGVGADATSPYGLNVYYGALAEQGLEARIPEVEALVYPVWYGWFEDVAQGLQVLASLAAAVALAAAVIWHGDYFVSKKAETAVPDAWDAAISRIHQRTVRGRDPD